MSQKVQNMPGWQVDFAKSGIYRLCNVDWKVMIAFLLIFAPYILTLICSLGSIIHIFFYPCAQCFLQHWLFSLWGAICCKNHVLKYLVWNNRKTWQKTSVWYIYLKRWLRPHRESKHEMSGEPNQKVEWFKTGVESDKQSVHSENTNWIRWSKKGKLKG